MKNVLVAAVLSTLVAACAATAPAGPGATAQLSPRSGSQVQGTLQFTQQGGNLRITGTITGHSAGPKGMHIHDKGDCSAPDAMSAAGHFNPGKARHGHVASGGHAGDLGNIVFDNYGKANVDITVAGLAISRDAPNGIVGRAVVIHAQADDLKTDPTGNSGGRVACGVIG